MDWKHIKSQALKACLEDHAQREYFLKLLEQSGIMPQNKSWGSILATIENLRIEKQEEENGN